MNDMIPFQENRALATKSLKTALSTARHEMRTTTGTPFLKLTRAGVWVYGQEGVEIEKTARWAINPHSLQHGWISWGDGEVLGEQMVSITKGRPAQDSLETTGVDWDEQVGVHMCCIEGADKGLNVIYKTTSLGGKNAFGKYFAALETQLDEDEAKMIAVCALESSSYQHKKYGEIFTPVIAIQHWVDMEGNK